MVEIITDNKIFKISKIFRNEYDTERESDLKKSKVKRNPADERSMCDGSNEGRTA